MLGTGTLACGFQGVVHCEDPGFRLLSHRLERPARSLAARYSEGVEPSWAGAPCDRPFDYPTELPLREVLIVARHCAGGVVLGFIQFESQSGILKPGTKKQQKIKSKTLFPTPWNQLESGVLFGLQLPLLVFREEGVEGGVFDVGVTDVFIHKMPAGGIAGEEKKGLEQVFLKWQSAVRTRYYDLTSR